MLEVLLFIILFLIILHLVLNCNEKARILNRIPGPPERFLLGNGWDLIFMSPEVLFKETRLLAKGYNGIYKFWAYPMCAVNIYNPQDIELILTNSKFNTKSNIYGLLKAWLGDGLLLSGGFKWFQRRKILTPAFHFNILRHFSEVLEENSHRMTEKINKDCKENKITINVIPVLSEYTLHSICETAMGTKLDEETSDAARMYKKYIYDLGNDIVHRFAKVYYFVDSIFYLSSLGRNHKKRVECVHSFTKKVIKDRKEYIDKNEIKLTESMLDNEQSEEEIYKFNRRNKIAMLDLLITAQKDGLIDNHGIQEEVDTFMFEGHDTTAVGLVYMLMLLANHKEVQDKIVAELKVIFGDSQRSATMQDWPKMKYLECCIKESLRLYPPVHLISREIKETTTLSGYEVPGGTACHIHIYDLHRREDLFKNAALYIPERFLPENSVGRHPYSYIPFSAGARNCIGQKFAMIEMKSAVSNILRKFELHPVTKPSDVEMIVDVVLRNNGPIEVSFVRRDT